jgi:superoxide dismutase, Cu-Zn family
MRVAEAIELLRVEGPERAVIEISAQVHVNANSMGGIAMKSLGTFAMSTSLLVLATFSAAAQSAKATLKDANGKEVGTAALSETPAGVLIRLSVKGLPPGERAFHIHGVGKCEPPFTSAGGHFNPGGKKHGLMAADGHHAGDLPNLHVPASGELIVEVLNREVTLEKGKPGSLLGGQGTALVVHAGKDDYKTDPAGDAGGRIACGLIE